MRSRADNSFDFKSLMALDTDVWDSLVLGSPDGWPFALTSWQRAILGVREWALRDYSFAMLHRGKLIAVMPLQFNPAQRVMASSGWGGSGPVVAAGLGPKQRRRILSVALQRAEEVASHANAERLEFWLSPVTQTSIEAPWGVNPFVLFGFEDESSLSQVIDLKESEEDLWRGLSETARHAVRDAREAGLNAQEGRWPDLLDAYYETHVETYTRTHVTPHPRTYFEGIAKEMWPRRHSILWVARNTSGRPIAFHNALWFKQSAFYHTACSTSEGLASGANYFLFWHAILKAKREGIRWYDCGQIAPGERSGKIFSLSTFKTKFGGEAHRFFRTRKVLRQLSQPASNQGQGSSMLSLGSRLLGRVTRRRI